MKYWLVKSEPEVFSISDLKREKTTLWDSVRNYQARNYLKVMAVGDLVLYYHSNAEPSGVAGICKVSKVAAPDPTQFDKKSEYFDPKATKEEPRWFAPEMKFVKEFSSVIPLAELKANAALKNMVVLQKGSRLSVQPVTEKEFLIVEALRR